MGEALVRLNHLLRPLIHHQWAVKVATLNRLDEYQLERFLFGAERVPLERVRGPIIELQEGRCFYCAERLLDVLALEIGVTRENLVEGGAVRDLTDDD